MEEAPENGKESPHSAQANGLIDHKNMDAPHCACADDALDWSTK
jgi:hypothetical protein